MTDNATTPARLEPPNGFLFEVTIRLESGDKFIVYVDYFYESFSDWHIPAGIQSIYPEAPVHLEINPNSIAAITAKPVPGVRVLKDGECPMPLHTRNGEAPF